MVLIYRYITTYNVINVFHPEYLCLANEHRSFEVSDKSGEREETLFTDYRD